MKICYCYSCPSFLRSSVRPSMSTTVMDNGANWIASCITAASPFSCSAIDTQWTLCFFVRAQPTAMAILPNLSACRQREPSSKYSAWHTNGGHMWEPSQSVDQKQLSNTSSCFCSRRIDEHGHTFSIYSSHMCIPNWMSPPSSSTRGSAKLRFHTNFIPSQSQRQRNISDTFSQIHVVIIRTQMRFNSLMSRRCRGMKCRRMCYSSMLMGTGWRRG